MLALAQSRVTDPEDPFGRIQIPTAIQTLANSRLNDTVFRNFESFISGIIRSTAGYHATIQYPDYCYLPLVSGEECVTRAEYSQAIQSQTALLAAEITRLEGATKDRSMSARGKKAQYWGSVGEPLDVPADDPPNCKPLHDSCTKRMVAYLMGLGYQVRSYDSWGTRSQGPEHYCPLIPGDTSINLDQIRSEIIRRLSNAEIYHGDDLVNDQMRLYRNRMRPRYDPRIFCSFVISWDS